MNIFFNMDRTDFIEQLRAGAIKSGGSPQLIDQIDSLHDAADFETELAETLDAKEVAEAMCSDLREELETLRDAVQAQSDIDPTSMSENLLGALKWANSALERHQ